MYTFESFSTTVKSWTKIICDMKYVISRAHLEPYIINGSPLIFNGNDVY